MQNYTISQEISQPTQSHTWKWLTILTGGSAHPGVCGIVVEAVVPEVSDFRVRPDPPGLQNQTERTDAGEESLIRVWTGRQQAVTQTPSHLLQSGYEEHGQSHQMEHGHGYQQEDHGCWEMRGNSWNSVYRQRNNLFRSCRVPQQNSVQTVSVFARASIVNSVWHGQHICSDSETMATLILEHLHRGSHHIVKGKWVGQQPSSCLLSEENMSSSIRIKRKSFFCVNWWCCCEMKQMTHLLYLADFCQQP